MGFVKETINSIARLLECDVADITLTFNEKGLMMGKQLYRICVNYSHVKKLAKVTSPETKKKIEEFLEGLGHYPGQEEMYKIEKELLK